MILTFFSTKINKNKKLSIKPHLNHDLSYF